MCRPKYPNYLLYMAPSLQYFVSYNHDSSDHYILEDLEGMYVHNESYSIVNSVLKAIILMYTL